jgi:cysteine sulfinate desulfinase/cysteine desulfurase-like protein
VRFSVGPMSERAHVDAAVEAVKEIAAEVQAGA